MITYPTCKLYCCSRNRPSTYLVGDRLSQADITVFTALYLLFTHVCDEECRNHYPHVVRWYSTIANQPQVMEVVGKVVMCSKEATFDAKKYAELHKVSYAIGYHNCQDGKHKTGKREDKPHGKHEKPKPKPKEDPVEPLEEEQPKPSKNPFAELPAGSFDMDAFKRVISNENIDEVAIPYFWDNFDPQTHSIWYCEYLYPEELTRIFMTCNLIGGMFQRLER